MKFLERLKLKTKQDKNKKFFAQLKHSSLSEEEISMIRGVVSIKEYSARDIMIPRVDVTALPTSYNANDLVQLLENSYHSRFPIYDQNIDDIRGVVHIREIFQSLFTKNLKKNRMELSNNFKESGKKGDKLSEKKLGEKNWLIRISKDPYFIPESRLLLDVLRDMQQAHIQMAIVVDEYGGFSGIVTMEDILEVIIGDVQDESDAEMEDIIQLEPGLFSVDARLDLYTINQSLGIQLVDDRADTIGGFVVNLFGRIPKKNQSIKNNQITFTVMTKKGNSVTRVKIDLIRLNETQKK